MGKESRDHPFGTDGLREDGISHYAADAHDMQTFDIARDALSHVPAPRLISSANSKERLFIAAFDGTWNDADADPEHMTNVGAIRQQIAALEDSKIRAGYVNGVGTQENELVRLIDGAVGFSYDQRLEQMYKQFMDQSAAWLREDPDAQIRLADIGFSRGAEQAAGFARLVHERGIQDPSGMVERSDESGHTVIEYTKPPLVPSGRIAQAVGFLDPVGTGEPRDHDRRLPPSVVSGFQLKAEDERRGLFKSTSLIDQGMTMDGRFIGVIVAGAHSDVGGGYHRNGLSVRSGNLMMDYLNALSDVPFLQKQPEPSEPGMNVVHRSEEGMLLYRLWQKVDRQSPQGVVETLAPDRICKVVDDCRNAEPRDEALAARFDFVKVKIGPVPPEISQVDPPLKLDATSPAHGDYKLLLQGVSAVDRLDAGMHHARDIHSDRLAAGLTVAARRAGLERIDHVLLSDKGDYAFAVQGDPDSPFKRWARIGTSVSASVPVDESLRQLEVLHEEQSREHGPQQSAAPTLAAMPAPLQGLSPAPAMSR